MKKPKRKEMMNQINLALQRNRCSKCRGRFTDYSVRQYIYPPRLLKNSDYNTEYSYNWDNLMYSSVNEVSNIKNEIKRNTIRKKLFVAADFACYTSFVREVIRLSCKCGGFKYILTSFGYHEVISCPAESYAMLTTPAYSNSKRVKMSFYY